MSKSKKQLSTIRTEKEFEKKVDQSQFPTIIIFKTTWSGESFLLEDIFDNIQEEVSEQFHFFSVDLEQLPTMKTRFFITDIPTVLFFKKGKIVEKIKQIMPKAMVKLYVTSFLDTAESA